MITAVDTNVFLDVFTADTRYGMRSKAAIESCLAQGTLVVCDIVWAELSSVFDDSDDFRGAMNRLGVAYSPVDAHAASDAGTMWRAYRRGGGRRERIMSDFLIAAHAQHHSERLLTRDRGFYRKYFQKLAILEPV